MYEATLTVVVTALHVLPLTVYVSTLNYRGCSKVYPTPSVYVATVGMYLFHTVVVAAWGVLPPGGRLPLQEAIHLPLRGPLRQPVLQQSHQVNTLICFVLYTVVWCTYPRTNLQRFVIYTVLTVQPFLLQSHYFYSYHRLQVERWKDGT